MSPIHIRALADQDDLDVITKLIREAYAQLSEMGLRSGVRLRITKAWL